MFLVGFLSTTLVGCSQTNGQSSGTASSTPTSTDSSATSSSQDLSGADLVYVNWNLGTADQNNLERQMVAAFNSTYHKNV